MYIKDDEREMYKMFCSKCGKELPDSAKFCSDCGTALNEKSYIKIDKKSYEEVDEKSYNNVNKNKIDKVQLIVIILSIVVTMLGAKMLGAVKAQRGKDYECWIAYHELFDEDESNDADAWERYKTLKENGDLPNILSTKETRRKAKEIEKLAKERGIFKDN